MFSEITADAYVMVDGDGTYDPAASPKLLSLLFSERLDMVIATRLTSNRPELFRRGHRMGNHLLTSFTRLLFGPGFNDMLSGYRVFSQRFAKSFPAISNGFEIETELTIHALQLKLPIAEYETDYDQYPALVALAADIGLAGFALRRERVEFLLKAFLGGFAGVDRAALVTRLSPRHCWPPPARRLDPAFARTVGWRAGSAST
jgi:hypothetical protein